MQSLIKLNMVNHSLAFETILQGKTISEAY